MAQKIKKIFISIATIVLLWGCNHKSNILYFYQFQDRTDCEYCFPAYCFYYDTAFHYTAIQYGFYENNNGFLRDSVFFTSIRDSIVAMKIPSTHNEVHFDSIKCYCEYPSHWRFTFEMTISNQGECQLFLYSPYYKEGLYFFDLTSSERRLTDYSACRLLTKDTGLFMTFNKRPQIPGDPIYFIIQLYHGCNRYSYIGNQDADDVPDEIFFFRDALGAIAQNHFSKQSPVSKSIDYQSISDDLLGIIHQYHIGECFEMESDTTDLQSANTYSNTE